MSREGTFTVESQVVEPRAPGIAVVQLANGHQLVAHLPRRQRELAKAMSVGDRVWVRLSACDLSQGLILQNENVDHESKSVSQTAL